MGSNKRSIEEVIKLWLIYIEAYGERKENEQTD